MDKRSPMCEPLIWAGLAVLGLLALTTSLAFRIGYSHGGKDTAVRIEKILRDFVATDGKTDPRREI
jgi:hypothetical protein